MNILHIDSSIMGNGSVSRQLSKAVIDQLKSKYNDLSVHYIDLAKTSIPHLTNEILMGNNAEQTALTEKLVDEYLKADVIVIGAAMYNFGLSSNLKAWIDRISASGKTFKYTANGAVGLAGDKETYVLSSRGGVYGDNSPADFQEGLMVKILNFTGVMNVKVIRAEGVDMGGEARTTAINSALQEIKSI